MKYDCDGEKQNVEKSFFFKENKDVLLIEPTSPDSIVTKVMWKAATENGNN